MPVNFLRKLKACLQQFLQMFLPAPAQAAADLPAAVEEAEVVGDGKGKLSKSPFLRDYF